MIDIARLTEEQTVELARRCLEELTDEAMYALLEAFLTDAQKGELVAIWSDNS